MQKVNKDFKIWVSPMMYMLCPYQLAATAAYSRYDDVDMVKVELGPADDISKESLYTSTHK